MGAGSSNTAWGPPTSRISTRTCRRVMRFARMFTPARPVHLEVYYYPTHTFNVDEMLECSRAGLEYFESRFSPFEYSQYRIMEYPRYRTFAQSFPNTVPY